VTLNHTRQPMQRTLADLAGLSLRLDLLSDLLQNWGRRRVTPATIADHDPPHKGDWNTFRLGPLQSLCRDCHQGKWADDARGYRSDIGDDGFPIDPRHPFNAGGRSRP
jgi:hypothetical protein